MDLESIGVEKIKAVVQAWNDCHQSIQDEKSFVPELRFFQDNKINIIVIEKADPNSLKKYIEEVETDFAILNQYGFIVENNLKKNCVISTIYYQNEYYHDYFILFEHEKYELSENPFDKVHRVPYPKAKQRIGFIYDTVLGSNRTIILPVIEQYREMSIAVKEAKSTNDWSVFEEKIQGCDLNVRSGSGETILHQLVLDTPPEIIKLALEKGANPNITNFRYGRNPAFYASSLTVHQILIDAGLNINHLDNSGWTAAQYTINRTQGFDILKLHVDSGLDLTLESIVGRTLLYEAIIYCDLEITNYLIEKGSNLDHQDNWGLTPLFVASEYEKNEVIRSLVKNGASLEVTTIKDYIIQLGGESSVLLKAGSTVMDLVNIIKQRIDSMNQNAEWPEWRMATLSYFTETHQLINDIMSE